MSEQTSAIVQKLRIYYILSVMITLRDIGWCFSQCVAVHQSSVVAACCCHTTVSSQISCVTSETNSGKKTRF